MRRMKAHPNAVDVISKAGQLITPLSVGIVPSCARFALEIGGAACQMGVSQAAFRWEAEKTLGGLGLARDINTARACVRAASSRGATL